MSPFGSVPIQCSGFILMDIIITVLRVCLVLVSFMCFLHANNICLYVKSYLSGRAPQIFVLLEISKWDLLVMGIVVVYWFTTYCVPGTVRKHLLLGEMGFSHGVAGKAFWGPMHGRMECSGKLY